MPFRSLQGGHSFAKYLQFFSINPWENDFFPPGTEPCIVKLELHRVPSNDNPELSTVLPPFFRRQEMNIHSALLRARCGFGGPSSTALILEAGALPSRQAASHTGARARNL